MKRYIYNNNMKKDTTEEILEDLNKVVDIMHILKHNELSIKLKNEEEKLEKINVRVEIGNDYIYFYKGDVLCKVVYLIIDKNATDEEIKQYNKEEYTEQRLKNHKGPINKKYLEDKENDMICEFIDIYLRIQHNLEIYMQYKESMKYKYN